MGTLANAQVFALDCQATGPSPEHGHLLEVGWGRLRANDAKAFASAMLVRLPEGESIPKRVGELTGIDDAVMETAREPSDVWRAVVGGNPDGLPAIVHYARLEERFLRALHQRFDPDTAFPFEIIDTHQIARRVLPRIPRRGLRALAGYFGHTVAEERRCAVHVDATWRVWRALVERLDRDWGITSFGELREWLARKPAAASKKRSYPMPKRTRLGLPDEPGVYRMLRSNGDLLYIGKAASIRTRVNSYFQKQTKIADRTLEMLTQARDVSFTVTATALEAALLESDEIKRCAPPYNVALRASGRSFVRTPEPMDEIALEGEEAEEALARLERMMRRTHWLCRLSESVLLFRERERRAARMLVISGGKLLDARDEPGRTHPPPPPEAQVPLRVRLARFDLATYDRMRVLSTELRRLVTDADTVELRLARSVWLDRERLSRTLAWV